MKPANPFLVAGAVFGMLAVGLGAFGAHGLEGRIEQRLLEVFEVGVRYNFYHALALVAVGILAAMGRATRSLFVAGCAFVLGTIVFSGSLYLMTFTGARWLGAITPIGGVSFMVGWIALAIHGWHART